MRHIRFLLFSLFLLGLIGGGGAFLVYRHYAADLPDYQALLSYQPPIATRVHAGDGRLLAEYATQKRLFVPIKAMPPRLIAAVLAAEDREFYQHGGVNLMAIGRAVATNLMHFGSRRRFGGASTITQQVTKNMLVGNAYDYGRKIREAILAVRLEGVLSKDRILELYLNEIYFGENAYGIAAASLNYFNKSLDELSLSETAFLAGIVQGPAYLNPTRHMDRAIERRNYVLDGMQKTGAITDAEMRAAMAEPIVTRKRGGTEQVAAPFFAEEVRRELIQRFGEDTVYKGGLSVRTSLDPTLQAIADRSMHDGLIAYDRRHGWRGPLRHIDLPANGAWSRALAAIRPPAGSAPWKLGLVLEVKADRAEIGLADGSVGTIPFTELAWARPTLEDQRVGANPKRADDVVKPGDVILVEPVAVAAKPGDKNPQFGLRQIPNVSGALVAINPHTGRLLAVVGGWSYEQSQFDRAFQAKRQVGSTMKPIAFLAALENGMTPSTLISSAPVEIDLGPDQPKYRPRNFEGESNLGILPLRAAIEKSVNTMTVRMAATIGIDKIVPYVERLGIMDKMPPYYSMVLGAGETTPLKITTGFSMLVNGGRKITPSIIDRVQDRNGQTIFRRDDRPCPVCQDYAAVPEGQVPDLQDRRELVLDPGTAYQMVNIMEGVVQRGTAAGAVGSKLRVPLAGKTGTTNDANDTWFIGFSPDLAVGIYVGFDNPRTLGPREQGASVAAPIFTAFMSDALKDKPAVDFRIPPGIRLVRVNAATGRFAEPGDRTVIWEAFKPGTEPPSADQAIEDAAGIATVNDDPGVATGSNGGVSDPGGVSGNPVAGGASPPLVPPGTPKPAQQVPETGGLY